MRTICYYHRIDMDGYCSGAVIKKAFPNAELRGWDYGDSLPNLKYLKYCKVILIDITFPLNILLDMGEVCELTVIDHHISFYKEQQGVSLNFYYYYDPNMAACEIGWNVYLNNKVPKSVQLISFYDTWRMHGTDNWENEILPFKEYCYSICDSAANFPFEMLETSYDVSRAIEQGKTIVRAFENANKVTVKNSFEKEVYNGYKALCVNYFPMSSDTLKSVWDSNKYDLMIGFTFNGTKWKVSLRSEGDFDVSIIAKEREGGGHKNAAGFETKTFEDIFI